MGEMGEIDEIGEMGVFCLRWMSSIGSLICLSVSCQLPIADPLDLFLAS
jgi:hypothetical protein